MAKRAVRVSAGLLMWRRSSAQLEFLLVHPGGPFFARKDLGAWSIPKGEADPDDDLLTRARTEFSEELGLRPEGEFQPLGFIQQKGGKVVHAWAVEGDLPLGFVLRSNCFELEWPPRSGKLQSYPEVDRAEFFPEEVAHQKINPAQAELLVRAQTLLGR